MALVVPIEDPADERVADYVGLTDAELRRRIETPSLRAGSRADGLGQSPRSLRPPDLTREPQDPGRLPGAMADADRWPAELPPSADGHGAGGGDDDDAGIFIAEGLHVIRRLLRSPYRVRSILVIPRRLDALADDLAGLDVPVYVAAPEVMNAIAGFDIHRGALASAVRRSPPDPGTLLARSARVCVLEGLADHENLGVIFRNAAALGMDVLLLAPGCCDPFYRRAVRVSMGHVLDVAHTTLEPWPDRLGQVADAGFRVVALTPDSSALPIDEVGLRELDRVALLLGSEDRGLTAEAMEMAHVRVRIPMAPGVDSLNVASAAAIAFHAARPSKPSSQPPGGIS